jgi:integrase
MGCPATGAAMISLSTGKVYKKQWRYCAACQRPWGVRNETCPKCGAIKLPKRTAYEYSVVVNGKQRRGQKPSKAEAQDALDAVKAEAKTPKPATHPDADLTLSAYADNWLKRVRESVEPKTAKSYADMLRLHVRPTLADVKVGELQRGQVKELLTSKRASGLSKDTVRLIRATLSVMLADAVDDGAILVNPASGLRGRKRLDKTTATERQQRIRPMTRQHVAALLDLARNARDREAGKVDNRAPETIEADRRRDQRDYALFLTMADAGLRPGEALALQWPDLDLTNRTMEVSRAIATGHDGTKVAKATKTGHTRIVDLTRRLADTLSRLQATGEADALAADRDPSLWVFPSDAGTPLDYAGVARRFRALLSRAKLPRHSPYDLRHTFATTLLAGTDTIPPAPITYVAAQMGHANPATTLRHYAHWLPRGDQRLIDRLEQAYTAISASQAKEVSPVAGVPVSV